LERGRERGGEREKERLRWLHELVVVGKVMLGRGMECARVGAVVAVSSFVK